MSSVDGSPSPRRLHPAAKWAIGIGIGCVVLAALCCGACSLGWFKGILPMAEKLERAEQDEQASRAAQREIEALDAEFPPTLPASVAEAMVTEDQLARYARIRAELAEPLARLEAETATALPDAKGGPSAISMIRTISGLESAKLRMKAEWRTCVEAALPVLRRETMGPTDLARLTEIVEWRYLRHPEARALGLAPADRAEMQALAVEAKVLEGFTSERMPEGARINGRDPEQMKSRLAQVNQRLEELRSHADLDVALSGPTLGLLDAHRGELEAIPSEGVAWLASLTQPLPAVDALEVAGSGASWEMHSSTGASAPAEALGGSEPPTQPEGASAP